MNLNYTQLFLRGERYKLNGGCQQRLHARTRSGGATAILSGDHAVIAPRTYHKDDKRRRHYAPSPTLREALYWLEPPEKTGKGGGEKGKGSSRGKPVGGGGCRFFVGFFSSPRPQRVVTLEPRSQGLCEKNPPKHSSHFIMRGRGAHHSSKGEDQRY